MLKRLRKRWFRKQRHFRRSLQNSRLHSIFGKRVFHPHVWKSDKRSVAYGLAGGLFIAFMPIPFQMLVAAAFAILLKVNMPVAVAACWVTNPLTMGPIFGAAYALGKFLLTQHLDTITVVNGFSPLGGIAKVLHHALYLTTGSLIFSVLAAIGGYLVVQILWSVACLVSRKISPARIAPDEKRCDPSSVQPPQAGRPLSE